MRYQKTCSFCKGKRVSGKYVVMGKMVCLKHYEAYLRKVNKK